MHDRIGVDDLRMEQGQGVDRPGIDRPHVDRSPAIPTSRPALRGTEILPGAGESRVVTGIPAPTEDNKEEERI
jgi:hypothetical protein